LCVIPNVDFVYAIVAHRAFDPRSLVNRVCVRQRVILDIVDPVFIFCRRASLRCVPVYRVGRLVDTGCYHHRVRV
jgi:hypothetical protein